MQLLLPLSMLYRVVQDGVRRLVARASWPWPLVHASRLSPWPLAYASGPCPSAVSVESSKPPVASAPPGNKSAQTSSSLQHIMPSSNMSSSSASSFSSSFVSIFLALLARVVASSARTKSRLFAPPPAAESLAWANDRSLTDSSTVWLWLCCCSRATVGDASFLQQQKSL